MFSALRKMLGYLWTTDHPRKPSEILLFSGSAYFSNRVPKALAEKWVAHGGEISSGATLDARTRYFFATDPSDPWVMKLFAKSVVVIHVGWIAHCIEEEFLVPIAEYVLDDMFIPGPPYKLTTSTSRVNVPPSNPYDHIDTVSGGHELIPTQTPDTPSTPTSMPYKRKREQTYFDSPSSSLVFSTFDKDGLPRRPRKLRKLRLDPWCSPEGNSIGVTQVPALDWFQEYHDVVMEDNEFDKGHGQHITTPRTPDNDKFVKNEVPYQSPAYGSPLEPTRVSPPATSINIEENLLLAPVRTIDLTNPPPPLRPRNLKTAKTRDKGMLLSVTKLTDNKVQTPKRISFADHARVRVYPVSPQRSDEKDGADPSTIEQCVDEGLESNKEARMSGIQVKSFTKPTIKVSKDSAPQHSSLEMNDGSLALRFNEGQPANDALTLTVEDVEETRRRLLELAVANGVDDGQLSALFELGKTFRGMTFRHVW